MGNFKNKVLGCMNWASGCFYNAAQNQFDNINYYAQNRNFRDTPRMALHGMGLTAMGIGYGATRFGSWCIDKGCTRENCYKAKCFGRNILDRGRKLFGGNSDDVEYTDPEVMEEQVDREWSEGNNLPAPFTQEDWDNQVPAQEYDETAYADIDDDYANQLESTDGEILAVEEEHFESGEVLAVQEEEYPPSEEYIQSLFEVDEREDESEDENGGDPKGGGEAADQQEATTEDTTQPTTEDDNEVEVEFDNGYEIEVEVDEEGLIRELEHVDENGNEVEYDYENGTVEYINDDGEEVLEDLALVGDEYADDVLSHLGTADFDNAITDEDITHYFDDDTEDLAETPQLEEEQQEQSKSFSSMYGDREDYDAYKAKLQEIEDNYGNGNYDKNQAVEYMMDPEYHDRSCVKALTALSDLQHDYPDYNPHEDFVLYEKECATNDR